MFLRIQSPDDPFGDGFSDTILFLGRVRSCGLGVVHDHRAGVLVVHVGVRT